jgi:hypothetical protein
MTTTTIIIFVIVVVTKTTCCGCVCFFSFLKLYPYYVVLLYTYQCMMLR